MHISVQPQIPSWYRILSPSFQKVLSCPFSVNFCLIPRGHHCSDFFYHRFLFFPPCSRTSYKWKHTVHTLAPLNRHIFENHPFVAFISRLFLLLDDWYSSVWPFHSSLVHSPSDRHVFRALATADTLLWTFDTVVLGTCAVVALGKIPRRGVSGLQGRWMFTSIRNC